MLGNAFDPEGISVNPSNGHMYISDEYGPSLYEFDPAGVFVRALNAPANIIPRDATGNLNYAGDRASTTPPRLETGRQDNRGFEGVTLSPDGSRLLAVMQAPLVNDSPTARDGRSSRNVRIVEFDTSTGNATKQYAYQLDALADINASVTANAPVGVNAPAFTSTQQGRSIGLSSIIPFGDSGTEYLVIERDNQDSIALTKAMEQVTELYLTEGKKRAQTWVRLLSNLQKIGLPADQIRHLQEQDDPALIAEVLKKFV